MELRNYYYYEKLLPLKIIPLYEIFIPQKFGAMQYAIWAIGIYVMCPHMPRANETFYSCLLQVVASLMIFSHTVIYYRSSILMLDFIIISNCDLYPTKRVIVIEITPSLR